MSTRSLSSRLFLVAAAGSLLACSSGNATRPDTTGQPATAGGAPASASGGSTATAPNTGAAGGTSVGGAAGARAGGPPPPAAGSPAAAGASGAAPGSSGGAAGTVTAPSTGGAGAPATGAAGAAAGSGAAAAGSGEAAAGSGAAGSTGAGNPGVAACPASSTLEPGDTERTVMIDGMPRRFIVHVPSSYANQPMPLVVDLHPLSQTAEFQRRNSGYQELSESEGFIVAWPQGIQNVWNVGPCCTQSREIHDVDFMRALVKDVSEQVCVDPKRVYADGYSMGGGMSHYLGCHAADLFATIAPSAFDLLEENSPDCKPARPITEIAFRGTADFIVPYAGGPSSPPVAYPIDQIHFLGAEGTFKRWAMLNECTGEPEDTGEGCQTYTQCAAGVEVTLCTAQGGSHSTGDAKRGWEMMKKHPMP
ncbi:MAG: PHB depolymerase family esterase [Polyangiales bacterium]